MKITQIELNESDIIEAAILWLREKEGITAKNLKIVEFGSDTDASIIFEVIQ